MWREEYLYNYTGGQSYHNHIFVYTDLKYFVKKKIMI
jgi:hypothetical protein